MCNICKSSLQKSKIRGTLIKKLRIVSIWSALRPPTPQRFLWNAVVYLLSPDILSRAQYPLPLASCAGTELQWLRAGTTGWVSVILLGEAVLAPCSSLRGEVLPGHPEGCVCSTPWIAAFLPLRFLTWSPPPAQLGRAKRSIPSCQPVRGILS